LAEFLFSNVPNFRDVTTQHGIWRVLFSLFWDEFFDEIEIGRHTIPDFPGCADVPANDVRDDPSSAAAARL
jgi:hypothetical protein